MSTARTTRQQQTLTDYFAAKKSVRLPAKQALEKLRTLNADLQEIKAKRASIDGGTSQKSPAFERYANLLSPKLDLRWRKSKELAMALLPPTRKGFSARRVASLGSGSTRAPRM